MKTLYLLTIILYFCFSASANTNSLADSSYTKPIINTKKVAFVLADKILTQLGGTCKWIPEKNCLEADCKGKIISIIANNPYILADSLVYQLLYEPVMQDSGLYVPLEIFIKVINSIYNIKLGLSLDSLLPEISVTNDTLKKQIPTSPKIVTLVKPQKKEYDIQTYSSNLEYLDNIKTIVVDAGHGGQDPGAIGVNGLREKDITLKIALKLRDLLKENTKFKVILTRETDVFIPLRGRTEIANQNGAHLFISIHCNSIDGNKQKLIKTSGYKIYFNKTALTAEDKLVAMKENSAIEFEVNEDKSKSLNPMEGIIFDMLSNEFQRESECLASFIVEEMSKSIRETNKQHTGIGQAGFYVLNGAYMPSVLVEVAYISNPSDSKSLKDNGFQKKVAQSILESILKFKNKYERKDKNG